jgi:hypothetical protein
MQIQFFDAAAEEVDGRRDRKQAAAILDEWRLHASLAHSAAILTDEQRRPEANSAHPAGSPGAGRWTAALYDKYVGSGCQTLISTAVALPLRLDDSVASASQI